MKGHSRTEKQHRRNGTFRKDRHAGIGIVEAAGEPIKPATLKGEAGKLWDRIVPELVAAGVAKSRDTESLVALCEAWARYRKYARHLDRMPVEDMLANRINRMADLSLKAFERLGARFGLTPADRARLRIEAETAVKSDPLTEFLNRGKKAK